MKIIEKNNRVQCKCGCIMEYEKSDIKTKNYSRIHNQLLFTRDYYKILYIICPQCEKEIEINDIYQGTY